METKLTLQNSSDKLIIQKKNSNIKQIQLNKPKQLNALDLDIYQILQKEFKNSLNGSQIVIFKGTEKAFSAGGDLKLLHGYYGSKNIQDRQKVIEFLKLEYTIDYIIATAKSQVISLLTGYTFGAGAGLSFNSKFLVATESTLFSMPENFIGLYPDVGSQYFLNKLKNFNLKLYLLLTGKRLTGRQLVELGLAHYYIDSSNIELLENELIELSEEKIISQQAISTIIKKFEIPVEKKEFDNMDIINQIFSVQDDFTKFYKNLVEISKTSEFANTIKDELINGERSPLSIRITYEMCKRSKSFDSLAQALQQDITIIQRMIEYNIDEFYEGISAKIVEKRKPNWKYKSLLDIPDEYIQNLFQPYSQEKLLLLY